MRDGCAEASCREEHITVQVYEWRFSFTWPCHFSSAVPSSFPLVSYLLHLITGRFISIQQPCQRVRRRQAWSCVLRFFASSLELHHSCTLTFRSLTYRPNGRTDGWMDGWRLSTVTLFQWKKTTRRLSTPATLQRWVTCRNDGSLHGNLTSDWERKVCKVCVEVWGLENIWNHNVTQQTTGIDRMSVSGWNQLGLSCLAQINCFEICYCLK